MKLTPQQFARAVHMDLEAVYKRLQSGKFGSAAQKTGRRWFIDVEAWRASELGHQVPDDSRTPPACAGLVIRGECEEHRCGCRWVVVEFESNADLVDWFAEVFEDASSSCDEGKESVVRDAVREAMDRTWPTK